MSNFYDLKHAVREGPPHQLFQRGDYLVNRFTQMNLSTEQVQTMSGADLAKEILAWAKEDKDG